MSLPSSAARQTRAPSSAPANLRRVAFATITGTTIEWYDFFLYASAAALVFPAVFFEPAGPAAATMLSFASVGVSFLFRPLGAFVAGHFGDRIGRKAMLVFTLILMGASTTLIGFLPTTEHIGITAVVLLVLMRILQGFSAGGEWGGAALMAVESAPSNRRGLWGTFPQIGVPLGMLLSSGVIALMTGVIAPGDAFLEWGWRVPFLLSVVLVAIGYIVRRSVSESPVFAEMSERKQQTKMPVVVLFRRFGPVVLLTSVVFAGNNAAGYMTTGGFIQNYTTDPAGALQLDRTAVVLGVMLSAVTWLLMTLLAGVLSDRIGRKTCYLIGWACQLAMVFPLFWLINTGSMALLYLAMCLFTVGLGFTSGPQAAWYAELYPATVRYSGVNVSNTFGAVLGGAFAPMIATWLVNSTGTTASVSLYLGALTLAGLLATLLLRDRRGIDLGIDNAEEQSTGSTVWSR